MNIQGVFQLHITRKTLVIRFYLQTGADPFNEVVVSRVQGPAAVSRKMAHDGLPR